MEGMGLLCHWVLSPRQNGFVDDIFKFIFLNENSYILLQVLLYFSDNGLSPNMPQTSIKASGVH